MNKLAGQSVEDILGSYEYEKLPSEALDRIERLERNETELIEALDLCFRRLEHKAATCKNHHWKVDDQEAFEKAQAALTKARK